MKTPLFLERAAAGLTREWLRAGLPLLLSCGAGLAAELPTAARPLQTIREIWALPPVEIDRGIDVMLEGVVIFADQSYRGFFLHDGTAGIYVKPPRNTQVIAGQRVTLEGRTDSGNYSPMVVTSRLVVGGRAQLPEPRTVTFEHLTNGSADSQWIEVVGVLRSVQPATDGGLYLDRSAPLRTKAGMYLELALSGGRFHAFVSDTDGLDAAGLIGATLRVSGACFTRFNKEGQLRAPWLGIPSAAQICVDAPAAPVETGTTIAGLLCYRSAVQHGTRARVRGIVTATAGPRLLFLQDDRFGVEVKTAGAFVAREGDLVDVIGFVSLGQFKPVIEDALVIPTRERRRVPPAMPLRAVEINGTHDATLVRVEGHLLRRVKNLSTHLLVLRQGESIFDALLDDIDPGDPLKHLLPGSTLAVTGVCVVRKAEDWNPSSAQESRAFHLRVNSPSAITVLSEPDWWTLDRLLSAIGVLAVVILAVSIWVIVLRRQVREQTEIIERQVKHEAVVDERARIAREFHDSLQQELAAITIQLDTLDSQLQDVLPSTRSLLTVARGMSRRSFAEVRRSVWDLRSHWLEEHDLPTALRESMRPLRVNVETHVTLAVKGSPQRLPGRTEAHLLRIGQEAVANALKHASARTIAVTLDFQPDVVELAIRDDGRGFDPENTLSIAGGHFGLLDMRERAEKIGATFSLSSRPGCGVEIVVVVPAQACKGVVASS